MVCGNHGMARRYEWVFPAGEIGYSTDSLRISEVFSTIQQYKLEPVPQYLTMPYLIMP
jgi:hypothetical protein